MIVIQPRMVAWPVIQIADICAFCGHGEGLKELVLLVLDEGDKPVARWVPSFAEEVKTARRGAPVGVCYTGHLLQRHYQLVTPGIHVHLPETSLAWGELVLIYVLNPDIISSAVLHPLEIMG